MAEDAQHHHVRQIVQRTCSTDLNEAVGQFNEIDSQGRCALVLAPQARCCLSTVLRIPTGASAIVQRFGSDAGEWTAGFHFAPPWVEVVYLVTKQSCTYYYSVANVPTKDNVMIKVEVTLVFRVLKAIDFVYKLGATKFDDGLRAVAEEAIRANVRQVKHTQIYSLRGSGADEIIKTLNKKFELFGVQFTNATIANVQLPLDLASALENATTYDAKMRQQIRSQEFALKVLNDENDKLLKELHLENERANAAEFARKERVQIDLDIKKSESDRKKQLSIIKAQQEISVLRTQSIAALENETTNTKASIELMIKRQQGESKAKIIEAEQTAEATKVQSEATLIEAENRSRAITLESEAEQKVFDQLQQRRQFDIQMGSIKALQNIAKSGKLLISGSQGKSLLDSITQKTPLLTK